MFGSSGATPSEVQPGVHRYEFACMLPPLIPSSFEGSYGHIRYHIEAVLDVPWGFDKEFKLQFHVIRIDNLNDEPALKLAAHNEEVKRFCCLCCETDPLIVTVTIPYSGFSPGQTIPVTVKYHNKSDVEVTSTKINLKRIVQFNRYFL